MFRPPSHAVPLVPGYQLFVMTPASIPALYISLLLLLCTFPRTARSENCCSLSEEQLMSMDALSASCPSSAALSTLSEKCLQCERNTCRVGFSCYCTGHFLSSAPLRVSCRHSFSQVWPESIIEEDRHWRSCENDFQPPDPSTKSCCAMNEEELLALVGTSNVCPSSSVEPLPENCDACPSGMCRVEKSCYCPSYFLDREPIRIRCGRAFGVAWPDSVGRTDEDLISCNGNDASTESTVNDSSDGASDSGTNDSVPDSVKSPAPSERPTVGGQNSTESPAPNEQPTTDGPDSTKLPAVSERPAGNGTQVVNQSDRNDEDNKLNTLELIGVIAGVVSAIIAVLVPVCAFVQRRRGRKLCCGGWGC